MRGKSDVFYQARSPAGKKQNKSGRSSDLSQPITPSRDVAQWLNVVMDIERDLQQRVLFRIYTGFPFHSPVWKAGKNHFRRQNYIKTRIRSSFLESF